MLRVILADDEQYERDYLEKVIRENYKNLLEIVYKATDGVDLMEKLVECKPQIVLLDIKMPRMDGLKAAEEIGKKYPDVQIVIISAYSDFSFAKQAIKLGVTDYLLKPYLDSELREALDKVIARVREREDSLALLSYSHSMADKDREEFDFYQDLEKDLLWNLFYRRRKAVELEKDFALWGVGQGWFKVVLISSPALINMGGFSQAVLKNYFQMSGVTVLNSIWMDQMAICLYSPQQDAFTELTGCINRARNYLAGDQKILVACGTSGTYEGVERLADAYEESMAFIYQYSDSEKQQEFERMTKGMRWISELEDTIIHDLSQEDRKRSKNNLEELIDQMEDLLDYQDVPVKLNFGRSLMTIIRGINRMPGIRIKTSEAVTRFEKLEQLNFNGDNLKYHVDFFSKMQVQKI
ncbi:response regulator [Clostridium sp. AN503]|uniref:response regulator n=1 Tax=Clostridium sp. AN503 TaxID=3160598 RepID=UPI003457E990